MQRGNRERRLKPEPAICITVRFYRRIELLSPTADMYIDASSTQGKCLLPPAP
ncbi:hypothetical protein WN55_04794 [Dufourea novaeangliae]|uniref:Uncharacterized protein n=1 Tax=Dufourea novaeangliae TaxID=178035 RepID=A0A154PL74_DUFNO|nr:hypothetical protein WN55_04794 [Dufourea novaeangliae]